MAKPRFKACDQVKIWMPGKVVMEGVVQYRVKQTYTAQPPCRDRMGCYWVRVPDGTLEGRRVLCHEGEMEAV